MVEIVLNILFIAIGYFVGIFGFAQILTIARFARPFTKYLSANKFGVNPVIYSRFNTTCFLWAAIMIIIASLVYFFLPLRFFALLIGYVCSIVSTWKFTGTTTANLGEYLETYGKYLTENQMDDNTTMELFFSYVSP